MLTRTRSDGLVHWSALVRLVRLAPGSAAAAAVGAVVAQGCALLLPVVTGRAVDRVVSGGTTAAALGAVVALLIVRMIADLFGTVAQARAGITVTTRLRWRLTRHIFALGVPGTRRYRGGDLVARVTTNAAGSGTAAPALVVSVVSASASVGGLVALCLVDWRLGVAYLAVGLPAVLLILIMMNRVTSAYAGYLERLAAIAARLADALAGARTIRSAGTAGQEIERVLAPLPDLSRDGRATWAVQRAVAWQMEGILTAVRVAVLAVAGAGLAAGRLSPGELLAVGMYLALALEILYHVDTLIELGDARANASRVAAVLADPPPSRRRLVPDGYPPATPAALSMRGVRIRIGDRTVLDGVDLDVPEGVSVALVGRSGAGKSTVALLAGRLLDPDDGCLLLAGRPLADLPAEVVSREVSYAFDQPVLLGRTLREAIGYGRPELGEDRLWRAAELAQAAGFIRRLPAGMATPVAGAPLSGGEIQRLGLARAFAHGGRLLILDDATSSLDTVTEARVTEAITAGLAGRTRLIVAHRPATADRADLVAWLDTGRVRAVAPHRLLWAREPAYRAVFRGDGGCAGGTVTGEPA